MLVVFEEGVSFMTDIRLVRAFCFSQDKEAQAMGFFETGMMSNGRVYFRNPYIEMPNEFRTCPQLPERIFVGKHTVYGPPIVYLTAIVLYPFQKIVKKIKHNNMLIIISYLY